MSSEIMSLEMDVFCLLYKMIIGTIFIIPLLGLVFICLWMQFGS